jgi:hypothetical protein
MPRRPRWGPGVALAAGQVKGSNGLVTVSITFASDAIKAAIGRVEGTRARDAKTTSSSKAAPQPPYHDELPYRIPHSSASVTSSALLWMPSLR